MNIFTVTEGLRGEDLITSIFRYLLLSSTELRECFIRIVSDKSKTGPILLSSHFSCLLQYITEDEESKNWGRLDLLVETDDSVIGIENKLYAGFQEGQPKKYLHSLKKYADGLSKLRNIESPQHIVVIIAPQSRKNEIKGIIENEEHLALLTWEEVLSKFEKYLGLIDSKTKFILMAFIEFVRESVIFIPRFKELVPHLRKRFDDYGSAIQKMVVGKLWNYFPVKSNL